MGPDCRVRRDEGEHDGKPCRQQQGAEPLAKAAGDPQRQPRQQNERAGERDHRAAGQREEDRAG